MVAGTRRRVPVPPPPPAKPVRRSPLILFAVAVILAAAGVCFTVARTTVANTAVVDAGATAEVGGQVGQGLERVFTFRFDNPEPTRQAAAELFTGDATGQYAGLFDPAVADAAKQRLELRSKVAVAGVTMLSGDRAGLLVFLDQSITRGDTGATRSGGAQLSVTAVRADGRWRVDTLQAR
ncbi:hypothetical protein EWH70_01690 [Amycolatopsis suaedae]|uniref:Twin-arginine translocation pathway signal n=1 Tax=Amycolatopsis suaedae TaxID=2510978 RepID=A0A4Q7JFT2_9PSEU|nr:hypothetical protein EWH70_01690 [Amycolatopsis suaedae]